jgi:hypothetical protein
VVREIKRLIQQGRGGVGSIDQVDLEEAVRDVNRQNLRVARRLLGVLIEKGLDASAVVFGAFRLVRDEADGLRGAVGLSEAQRHSRVRIDRQAADVEVTLFAGAARRGHGGGALSRCRRAGLHQDRDEHDGRRHRDRREDIARKTSPRLSRPREDLH